MDCVMYECFYPVQRFQGFIFHNSVVNAHTKKISEDVQQDNGRIVKQSLNYRNGWSSVLRIGLL